MWFGVDDDAAEVGNVAAKMGFQFLGEVVNFGDATGGVNEGMEGQVNAGSHALKTDVLAVTNGRELLAGGKNPFDVRAGLFRGKFGGGHWFLVTRFDVDVDVGQFFKFGAQLLFQAAGLGVRPFKGQGGFDFEVQVNVHAFCGVVGGDVMNGKMSASRHGVDALKDVFLLGGGDGVHDDVGGGGDGVDDILDVVRDFVAVLEGVMSGDGDTEVHKNVVAGTADASTEDAADAGELSDGRGDFISKPCRGSVEKGIYGAAAKFPTDMDDDESDDKGGDGVGLSAADAEADEEEAAEDDE